jgi:hypothetical protein
MKGLLALAVGSLSLSLLISEANAKNPHRFRYLSNYNPTYYKTKTGKDGAIATITFQRTENGWKPIYPTGKKTPTWSDDYLARFKPTINGDQATITAKFIRAGKKWTIRRPPTKQQPQ